MANSVDCLTLLTDGDFWTGIVCPFTNLMPDGWFYMLMIFALELIIMVKYDNIVSPAVMGIFLGTLMIGLMPPGIMFIVAIILVVNFAAILYAVIFRGE